MREELSYKIILTKSLKGYKLESYILSKRKAETAFFTFSQRDNLSPSVKDIDPDSSNKNIN